MMGQSGGMNGHKIFAVIGIIVGAGGAGPAGDRRTIKEKHKRLI